MDIITPQVGLFFWTVVIFLGFFFILRKLAWKPIITALHEREDSIESSLAEAAKAREEMAQLTAENEALLKEARIERDKILNEANAMKDQIVKEARVAAQEEAGKEREKAKAQIEAEKRSALAEIKSVSAQLAVEVAEKILRKEFEDSGKQEEFAKGLISELNDN